MLREENYAIEESTWRIDRWLYLPTIETSFVCNQRATVPHPTVVSRET